MANRLPNHTSLYVGDLSPEVTEAVLFEEFKAVGPIMSIRVCRDASSHRSLGYAYVNFQNATDAERCLETLNFTNIKGKPCRIMWSQRDPGLRRSNRGNIFIKSLHPAIDNKALYDTFSAFGNILSCKVVTNSTGESAGYGFVHFETEEAANNAIAKVNGMLLNSKQVYVGQFVHRTNRQAEKKESFTNVYLKHLAPTLTKAELDAAMAKFGAIKSSMLATTETGASRGFAFINFEEHAAALKAIEELHDTNSEQNGGIGLPTKPLYAARHQKKAERQHLREQWAKERRSRYSKYVNLYIKNLDENIDDAKLREAFESFGVIISAKVMRDSTTGVSKGFGFVSFREPEEANKAVAQMNGKIGISAKPIYVCQAQKREERRAQLLQRFGAGSGSFVPPTQPSFPMNMPMNQPFGQQPYSPYNPQAQPAQQNRYSPSAPRPPANPFPQPPAGSGARNPYYNPTQVGRNGLTRQPAGRPMAPSMQPNGFNAAPNMGLAMNGQYMKPQQQMQMPKPVSRGPLQAAPHALEGDKLTAAALHLMAPDQQKNTLGERLFSAIAEQHPELAAKITGMLLEMDNLEILRLLDNSAQLNGKVQEALDVLQRHPDELKMARVG
eukprot:NODE_592_length_2042_cov_101.207833_g550_i0.p1 GENE.NODE_592_length_2042_cov_101.207833_g550_i0~~NODE_592_length_2042_cov_101.207833_g550_i0.p1  ORF type:complete len:612 (+),score=174.25 NODE_592_length_2042_cov_101.207833_g550_i0:113-1948(+)